MEANAANVAMPPNGAPPPTNIDDEEFWPRSKVLKQVGISKSTMFVLIKLGKFPRPIRVGNRSFWLKSEVIAWKHAMIERAREQFERDGGGLAMPNRPKV